MNDERELSWRDRFLTTLLLVATVTGLAGGLFGVWMLVGAL